MGAVCLRREKKIEQRVCLTFCVSNRITAMKPLNTLQKCSGESRTQVFEWQKAVTQNFPHASLPSISVSDDKEKCL